MQTYSTSFFLKASVFFLAALGANAQSVVEDEDLPDPIFLSTDLYFTVSDLVISVPAVALKRMYLPPENRNPLPDFLHSPAFGKPRWFETREYKEAVLQIASSSEKAATVSAIRLNFGYYGTYGEYGISSEICPRLTNAWSKKACANQLRREHPHLPKEIHLSTRSGLELFHGHSFAGVPNVSVADLLSAMEPLTYTAKISCTKGQRFCKAAMMVSDNVVVVWSPKCIKGAVGVCRYEYEAEGAEIGEFVLHNLRVD